jgi:hypothetical protein
VKGLRLVDGISRKDFRIVVGSEAFVCDRFQAAFLSPRIAGAIGSDPTIDEFVLGAGDGRSLGIIRRLVCGENVELDDMTVEMMKELIEELENVELSAAVLGFVDRKEKLTVSNCIGRREQKLRLGLSVVDETGFIASHFSDMNLEEIRSLEVNAIEDILSHPSLKIGSEDWLLNFILELDDSYWCLINHVRLSYLSPEAIDLLFQSITLDQLDDHLWRQIQDRMRHRIIFDIDEIPRNRFHGHTIGDPDSPWSGLFSHLGELCGGNVHEKGIVEITCSSTHVGNCWEVANSNSQTMWHTANSANGWIQFDLKDRWISLTHYTLKSGNGYNPLRWVVSGSIDGKTWKDLDVQNTDELSGTYVTKVFECSRERSGSHCYRYIRLTQTGPNSNASHTLALAGVEFFGSVCNYGKIGIVDRPPVQSKSK